MEGEVLANEDSQPDSVAQPDAFVVAVPQANGKTAAVKAGPEVERRALKLGDHSIAGLEDVSVVEHKDLSDLVRSFAVERSVFVDRPRRMARHSHKLFGHYCCAQPDQISIPKFGSQSEPDHPVFGRGAGRLTGAVCRH